MSARIVEKDEDSAQDDLESSLGDITDIAAILLRLGQLADSEPESYLGSKLEDAANVALDCFARIFKLNQYNEQKTGDEK